MRRLLIFISILFLVFSCANKETETALSDFPEIQKRDTLIITTMYGSSSYFTFKGVEMGFDYEMCEHFAEDHNLVLKLVLADSEKQMVELLHRGEVDVIAYRLAYTNELKDTLAFTQNEYINNQVLIQRKLTSEISSVVDLIGKEVYVLPHSKYSTRLANLNEELGGGIIIKEVADSVTIETLIEQVSTGAIDYTIAENDIAQLNKSYFRNLDTKIPVSFNQRSAWAVRKSSPLLLEKLNTWFAKNAQRTMADRLYIKYFEKSKYFADRKIHIPKGALSPYDALFKEYAKKLDWDWILLAAQCYEESQFDSSAVSWAGASGLMQLMPRTARNYDLDEQSIFDTRKNIQAATKYLKMIDKMFVQIEDIDERTKFVLAAYNSGPSHVLDAMALAEKYGANKKIWKNNVETYLLLKSKREYYSDPIVKSGYFRGVQTVRYVNDVLRRYDKFKKRK